MEAGRRQADCGKAVIEARKGLAAKTPTQRVQALRAARDALGLRRLELYAHPEDWPAIKALADKLQRRRSNRRQVNKS